ERKLYQEQIGQFIKRLPTLFYDNEILLEAEYCRFKSGTPRYDERKQGKYKPIKVGDTWGKNWQQAWFHIRGEVPKEWKGRLVAARINVGGEGAIFDSNGTPVFALSYHSIWMTDFRRDRYIIAEKAKGGEKVDLWVDATAAQLFGLKLFEDPSPEDADKYGKYEATVIDLALGTFRRDIWELAMDVNVLDNLMHDLPDGDVRRARILQSLRNAVDAFQPDEESVAKCRALLKPELQKRSSASALNAVAVGHAHIDTAWLWPLHETRKKCARTFTAQLDLIERFPGYIFGASQAQHYQFIKEDHPALYKQIKKQIAAGTWEVQGGMWLEADCNLISGESMVRQFLHGMNFFRDEFDVTVKNLWLPDVFGYSAAMPQILQGFDIDVMVTQKISWSQFNKFPHHSFVWRGIDGSEIVVHFPPEDSYNSELKPSMMRHAERNFAQKAVVDDFLVVFGVGDGGGGPTEEILANGIRQRNLEGSPKVRFSAAQPMLDKYVRQKNRLPRWVGELYLEFHRGTLTTHAYNKKMNRFMELKMRELEFLYGAFAMSKYPQKKLDAMWKVVLLNQFHDIIPGSSISHVYKDSHRQYRELEAQVQELESDFIKRLSGNKKGSVTFVNTLSFTAKRPLEIPTGWDGFNVLDSDGKNVEVQKVDGKLYTLQTIAPLSSLTLHKGEKETGEKQVKALPEKRTLENRLIRYEFDEHGQIRRIYDKQAKCDVLARGKSGNVLNLYEDRPNAWDAWDIDIFYENQWREHAALSSWRWISAGPLLSVAEMEFTIGQSLIKQRLTLSANSKRLEFDTWVDWKEKHKMLRVGFTANVEATEASYEIQYGTIKRPTHRNTSWDMAKFEVVGHRFADLSDNQYGVAILNDCKYGHKIHDNYIELNLLRSPNMPDPDADQCEHRFTYALLPHENVLHESSVLAEAAVLNQPPLAIPNGKEKKLSFPVSLDSERVVLEVLKKAEKEDAIILRLYEPHNMRCSVNLTLVDPEARLFETNMLEEGDKEMRVNNGVAKLKFKPFEIKTFKITRS
ncbi:MAG: glycoside hydrolase family 38 C-terminal domain-containing protein, partial [Calditrichota bacterium]